MPNHTFELITSLMINTLCALAVVINPKFRGENLSKIVLSEMKGVATTNGIEHLIVPVRPSKKSDHPNVDMSQYITWKNYKGEYYDPWLNVHSKIGGKLLKVCDKSMYIDGSIEQWEAWTDLTFDNKLESFIPTGLVPLRIDPLNNYAYYIEPNVWFEHPLKD